MEVLRKHERTGRPLGEDSYVDRLEGLLDRCLKPQKPGRKLQNRLYNVPGYPDSQCPPNYSTSAWVGTYCNPFRRHWASRYLKWIRPENLNVMGYDYDNLKSALRTGKNFSMDRIFSDMAFSIFLSIRKTVSPLSVHRNQHFRHLYI